MEVLAAARLVWSHLEYALKYWPYAAAFVFAVVLPTYWIMEKLAAALREQTGETPGKRWLPWQGKLVGCVERGLYVTAFLAGHPEFVAVWLALKVAGQWQGWKAEGGPAGHIVFNNSLVLNAFSIGYAFAATQAVEWFRHAEYVLVAVPFLVVVANLFVTGWVRKQPRPPERPVTKPWENPL